MQAAVGPAQALAAAARADEEAYRKQVDVVAMATFESGNLDQLDALLAARSPAGLPRPDVGAGDDLVRVHATCSTR